MMNGLFCWLVIMAQVTTPPGSTAEGGGAAPAPVAADGGFWSSILMFLPMMLAIMFIYMLIMNKPQQKEQTRMRKLLSDLKRNDRVVTAGGILGTVVNVSGDSEYVSIRIDETNNTKLQVLKQSIIRVIKDPETAKDSGGKPA